MRSEGLAGDVGRDVKHSVLQYVPWSGQTKNEGTNGGISKYIVPANLDAA